MRDLIKDTLPLIEEEKKALAPGGFKLGTIAITTSPPPLPKFELIFGPFNLY